MKTKLLEYNDVIEEKIENYYEKYYSKLTPKWMNLVLDPLNLTREEERLALIMQSTGWSIEELKKKSILEIGSGFGGFVINSRNCGIGCYGIEPDEIAVTTHLELLRLNSVSYQSSTIVKGIGETLPYKSKRFDLVVSFQVLEHTKDPEKVIREAIRVLKKGGMLYFNVPNHLFFWEGHYGLFWLPLLPKWLGSIYVRLLGRDSSFLTDELQYITKKRMLKAIQNHNVQIIDWGEDIWKSRLRAGDFSAYGQTKKLLKLLSLFHKVKIMKLIEWVTVKLGLFYPLIIVAKKKN